MKVNRWTVARRCVQLAVVALLASPLWSREVFEGTLASASLLGLKLSDPLATLQVLLLTGTLSLSLLIGSATVLIFYGLLGGRVFCGWVCPVHLLTDLTDLLPWTKRLRCWPLSGKTAALVAALLLSLLFGVPAFETVSPIGIAVRSLTFGGGLGALVLLLVVLTELLLARRAWCRSLCPLGGLYALLGRVGPLRVAYDGGRCIHCGRCSATCFVPEVLEPSLQSGAARVTAGDCSRCGACIGVCPTAALTFNCARKTNKPKEVER